jgi:hypothetical protein
MYQDVETKGQLYQRSHNRGGGQPSTPKRRPSAGDFLCSHGETL